MDCGYRGHPAALEFDHRDGRESKTIGSMCYSSRNLILMEIDKCDVVCANCHAIRTYVRRLGSVVELGYTSVLETDAKQA